MMVDIVRGWFDFFLYVCAETPALAQALQMYPVGMALGIYWTQGIKRSQRKKRWRGRENLTSLELRCLSGCISGLVISLIAVAFHSLPNRQVLAHALLGGAAAPLAMMLVIETLSLIGRRVPWVADYVAGIKRPDLRREPEPAPPPGVPERRAERRHDESGAFWANRTGGD